MQYAESVEWGLGSGTWIFLAGVATYPAALRSICMEISANKTTPRQETAKHKKKTVAKKKWKM